MNDYDWGKEMIVYKCKWLWMNWNDCGWIEMIMNEWKWLWMNGNDCERMEIIGHDCERMEMIVPIMLELTVL